MPHAAQGVEASPSWSCVPRPQLLQRTLFGGAKRPLSHCRQLRPSSQKRPAGHVRHTERFAAGSVPGEHDLHGAPRGLYADMLTMAQLSHSLSAALGCVPGPHGMHTVPFGDTVQTPLIWPHGSQNVRSLFGWVPFVHSVQKPVVPTPDTPRIRQSWHRVLPEPIVPQPFLQRSHLIAPE